MMIILLTLTLLHSDLPGPTLDCRHQLVRRARIGRTAADWAQLGAPQLVRGNLDDSGRMLFTRYRQRFDLISGQISQYNLYQVAIGDRRLVVANNVKVEGDVDSFHDWKSFRLKPDRIEGTIQDLAAAPVSHDGNRLLIWAQYFSGTKHCYAIVDLARPERGSVLLYSDSNPVNGEPLVEPIPVWSPLHANDAQEWLVEGQIRKEDGTLISKVPVVNGSGEKWSASLWSSKLKTAFWIKERNDLPWQLAETTFSGREPHTATFNLDLPDPLARPFSPILLPSGRLLVQTGAKDHTQRYHLALSDKARRHWRKIGDYVLRGASLDGKYILIGGPKLSDKQWVVQITE